MKLSTYHNLQQKSDIYKTRYQRIDKWTDLEKLLHHDYSADYVFRGMCEAKHKNYTSAQRYYITHELEKSGLGISQIIQDEAEALLEYRGKLMLSYFDSIGVEPNWFLLNSFLQHYGGITPLLDFTKNPLIALFFMQEGASVSPCGNDDIDNYCSLYYIGIDEMDTVNTMIKDVVRKFSDGYEKIDSRLESAEKEKYPEIYKMTKEALDSYKHNTKEYIDTFLSQDMFKGYEQLLRYFEDEEILIFIDNKSIQLDSNVLDFHKRMVMTTNLNIIAQEGVFVMRAGMEPLENEKVHCIDVHKSLIPTIRKYLKRKGVTKEHLFPQEERIADNALEQSMIF